MSYNRTHALIGSLGIAVIATIARLISGTSLQQAVAGCGGVAIGAIWAWRTGDAHDYFAFGLWTNAAYLAACLISIIVRWPLVGLIIGVLTGKPSEQPADPAQRRAATRATAGWHALSCRAFGVIVPVLAR